MNNYRSGVVEHYSATQWQRNLRCALLKKEAKLKTPYHVIPAVWNVLPDFNRKRQDHADNEKIREQ